MAAARWLFLLALVPGLWAQSVVFVSPSTKGMVSLACAAGSLDSFEELHYLAAAHSLSEHLCPHARIEAVAGLWKGQAENSGMIDDCPELEARELGALLGRYYYQKAALVFARSATGQDRLVSFRVGAKLGLISQRMREVGVRGASVVPHEHDSLVIMVVTNKLERGRARKLCAVLRGKGWLEEPGTAELIGDEDRGKAQGVYDRLIEGSPAQVSKLEKEMYSEKFAGLGLAGRGEKQ